MVKYGQKEKYNLPMKKLDPLDKNNQNTSNELDYRYRMEMAAIGAKWLDRLNWLWNLVRRGK